MDNNISAWLEKADDDMLDDFDPDEDDSDGDVLDNPENSDESVENESDSEMSCSDDSIRNDFRGYNKGEYCTIDEMLEGFRGRCKFRQYIVNKPNKYGIKIFALVDSRVFYTVNMEIYAGKQPIGPFLQNNSGASVVKRMIKPIAKTGHNITIDNWFTSVPLAVELLKDYKTTMVDNNCLLLSYVPKKGKNVMMLSTMHTQGDIDPNSGDKKLPEVISFYNMSKGGVDVVDELKGEYSVSRNSHRWPLTVFFSLLNIAGINSQIIYKSNTDIVIPRRKFLKQLGLDLCKPHMVRRQSIPTLSIPLRQQITRFSGVISSPETGTGTSGKAKCFYCPKKETRYTVVICATCSNPICKKHTTTICDSCICNTQIQE
ncbi:hypothetical protein QTP88_005632 [Uroleucon formosanum]